MASPKILPPSFLNECLEYDPGAGVFNWKTRPQGHFPDKKTWSVWNATHAGKKAGHLESSKETLQINLTYKGKVFRVLGHQAAWCLTYGVWPKDQIDHKNRIRKDNRLKNLREATNAENHQNQRRRKDNTSGHTGVSLHKATGSWEANLHKDGRRHCLGYYKVKGEAAEAVRKAKAQLHTFHPVLESGQ